MVCFIATRGLRSLGAGFKQFGTLKNFQIRKFNAMKQLNWNIQKRCSNELFGQHSDRSGGLLRPSNEYHHDVIGIAPR